MNTLIKVNYYIQWFWIICFAGLLPVATAILTYQYGIEGLFVWVYAMMLLIPLGAIQLIMSIVDVIKNKRESSFFRHLQLSVLGLILFAASITNLSYNDSEYALYMVFASLLVCAGIGVYFIKISLKEFKPSSYYEHSFLDL